MNFVKTTDQHTAEELIRQGFKLINQSGSVWTFLNNGNVQFSDDNKKIVYSNKLEM